MAVGFSGWGGEGAGAVTGVTDTNSVDLTLAAGNLSGAVRISADAADANNSIVSISIRSGGSPGLRAQILNATIRALLSATGPIAYDNTTGIISIPVSSDGVDGYLSGADHTTYSAAAALAHAAVTLAVFGSTPNANGLSLTAQALTMEPAAETFPGGVSIAAQVFGGEKRFPGGIKVGSNAALTTSLLFEIISTTLLSAPMPSMTVAERNAIATPATGGMLYNSSTKHPEYYNGSIYQPIGHAYTNGGVDSITDASTLTPEDSRNTMKTVAGNGGAVSVADISTANAKNADRLIYVGTDDTNTVTFVTSTGVQTNGSCTLGSGDSIEFMYINALSKWIEMNRTA